MNEWVISLESKGEIPLYEQICEYFKKEIQEGRLAAGKRLPSSRALAANLSVSRSTVDLAYDQLVSEGYIESIPCKGYYVCQIDGLYYEDIKKKNFLKKEAEVVFAKTSEPYTFDFAPNGIAPGSFPHNTWKKLSKQVLTGAEDDLFALGNPCGEKALRQAIAEYLHQARGVLCRPEQILVGAGNDYLLMLLCTILGRRKRVAMENPTYPSAWHDFRHMGYEMCTVGQDARGIRIKDLEKAEADLVYVMPSHQFPMGTVMPLKRRIELLRWAAEKAERYIIEDDYDSEFRYKGKPIPALQGFDKNDRVIYLGTFSKSIAPSIRISYMVLPETLMRRYLAEERPFSVTVSKADQCILELFLSSGYYGRHLNRMRSIYKTKHDILLKHLKEMTDICTYSGENAGVHMLIHLKNGLSEKAAVKLAAEAGVKVYGLSEYFVVPHETEIPTIILGYATMSDDMLDEAMEILRTIWKI